MEILISLVMMIIGASGLLYKTVKSINSKKKPHRPHTDKYHPFDLLEGLNSSSEDRETAETLVYGYNSSDSLVVEPEPEPETETEYIYPVERSYMEIPSTNDIAISFGNEHYELQPWIYNDKVFPYYPLGNVTQWYGFVYVLIMPRVEGVSADCYIGYKSFYKDSWNAYLGSSKSVIDWARHFGACHINRIMLSLHDTKDSAIQEERYLHRLYNVNKNPRFFNGGYRTILASGIPFSVRKECSPKYDLGPYDGNVDLLISN